MILEVRIPLLLRVHGTAGELAVTAAKVVQLGSAGTVEEHSHELQVSAALWSITPAAIRVQRLRPMAPTLPPFLLKLDRPRCSRALFLTGAFLP